VEMEKLFADNPSADVEQYASPNSGSEEPDAAELDSPVRVLRVGCVSLRGYAWTMGSKKFVSCVVYCKVVL